MRILVLVFQVSGRKHYLYQLFNGTYLLLLVGRSDLCGNISILICVFKILMSNVYPRTVKIKYIPHYQK